MLWIPRKGRLLRQTNVTTTMSSDPGTLISADSGSSAKGTVVQVIASTDFDAYWLRVMMFRYGASGSSTYGCTDILIGTSAEEVLIPDLLHGGAGGIASASQAGKYWDFPLYIPAGSRISARMNSVNSSSGTGQLCLWLYGCTGTPDHRVGQKVVTYGASGTRGTAITPGASGAEGSWTQITATTSEDHFALVPSFQVGSDSTQAFRQLALDLGLGAATEEQIFESYMYGTSNDETMSGPVNSWPHFQDIPSGSRLTARVSNGGTNDAEYDAVIHGVS